jgi:hypothetical protein
MSIAVGKKITILTGVGPLNLNLFFLTIGPSGIGNKSLPLKYVLIPTVIELSRILGKDLIFPTRFSVEGLIKWYSEVSPEGGFIRDEFTGILKETGKGYLADVLEFLSELYDGTLQKRFTMKIGLNEIKNVYVSFISATTPYLYKIMKPEFWMQGTGNRIIIDIFDIETVPKEAREVEYWQNDPGKQMMRDEKILEFAQKFASLRDSNIAILRMDDESLEIWVNYRNKLNDEIKERWLKDDQDIHSSYIARMAEMAVKIAGLHFLSRQYDRLLIEDTPELLVVEKEDIEYGINRMNKAYSDFKKMLIAWRRHKPAPAPVMNVKERVHQYVSALDSAPNKMLNITDWDDQCTTETNKDTMRELRRKAEAWGWVREVTRHEVENVNLVLKLWTGPHTKVYTTTKEFIKT